MNTHRSLKVWQFAQEIVQISYRVSKQLPDFEKSVAAKQLIRAAWSIQNNIAEGNARLGPGERRRFFDIALGSLAEVDAILATLNTIYLVDEDIPPQVEQLRRQINAGLMKMIKLRGAHTSSAVT